MKCSEVRVQLSAYVDHELSLSESLAVEQHLAGCAECSVVLAEMKSLSGALSQARFDAPDSLRMALESKMLSRPEVVKLKFRWAPMAVAASIFVAFFVGRWSLPTKSFASDLVASNTRSLIGNHLIDVESSDRHTVKPWFVGKIDYSPTPYDLKDRGFELKGGRLDYVDGETVPVFVYQHEKHVLNLYVFKGDKSLGSKDMKGYHLARWTSDGFTYIAFSDVAPETLRAFEEAFESASKTP